MFIKIIPIAFIFLLLTGCAEEPISSVDVEMFNQDGDSLGVVAVKEDVDGVKLEVNLEGLPEGVHGFHIHDTGKCEGPDFKSAGDHYNPTDMEHGRLNPKGAHAGDLPNLIVEADGKVSAELMAAEVSLRDEKTSLLKGEGTSLVIHQSMDDGMTQPVGDAGIRIACGVITKEEAKRDGKKEVEPKEEEKK